jgi:hypothetical protein
VNFSYHDYKEALYVLQTLFGFLFVFMAFLLNTTAPAGLEVFHIVPAIILVIVGIGCIFFGVETYLLRDDPDIWR